MRVTNGMMTNTLIRDLNNVLSEYEKWSKYALGKKVNKASDDPIAAAKILRYKTDLNELASFKETVEENLNWYDVTDSTLKQLTEAQKKIKDIAERAANGTFDAVDRESMRSEINGIKSHIVSLMNTNFMGKYIFSGNQIDKPLLKEDGNYNINITDTELRDPTSLSMLISPNERIKLSTSGVDVLGVDLVENGFSNIFGDVGALKNLEDKIIISGRFDLEQEHLGDKLKVTVDGKEYDVKIDDLRGTKDSPILETFILKRFREAKAADGQMLTEVINDIYFDEHGNLNIECPVKDTLTGTFDLGRYSVESNTFNATIIGTGRQAKTSELIGDFALSGLDSNYSNIKSLELICDGHVGNPPPPKYVIDLSKFNGAYKPIKKEKIIEHINNSLDENNRTKVSDRYDVYFNQDDKLVISLKGLSNEDYADTTLRLEAKDENGVVINNVKGYSPKLFRGRTTVESDIEFRNFVFDDDYILKNKEDLSKLPILVEIGGNKKRILLPENEIFNNSQEYVDALQKELNAQFGENVGEFQLKTDANGQHFLSLKTVNTLKGNKPFVRLEATRGYKPAIIRDIEFLESALSENKQTEISEFLDKWRPHYERLLSVRSDVGARYQHMEISRDRIDDNQVSFKDILSKAQDTDFHEAVIKLETLKNIYQASLSAGGRIVQPTLLDFIK